MTKSNYQPQQSTIELLTPDQSVPRLLRLGDLISDWNQDAAARYDARQSGRLLGPITGLAGVDAAVSGSLASGLHMITGAPGTGKTAFALQIAAQCGFPALFISCEMSPLELLRRIAARVTGTYLGRFKTGELPPEKADELVTQALAAVPQLAIGDATTTYAAPDWIRTAACATKGDAQHVLVVVDSLHSWVDADGQGDSEYERLGHGIRTLQAISADLGAPILCVTERNRSSMANGGLGSGAGNRKIEYGAETQLDLNRDQDAKPDFDGFVPVQLILPKNRHGVTGVGIDLLFQGARQEFTLREGRSR